MNGGMSAKSTNAGKARTDPKGRATMPRNAVLDRRRLLTPTMEWVLAVIVIIAVLALIFVVFGDVRSTTHSGAPLGAAAAQTVAVLAPTASMIAG